MAALLVCALLLFGGFLPAPAAAVDETSEPGPLRHGSPEEIGPAERWNGLFDENGVTDMRLLLRAIRDTAVEHGGIRAPIIADDPAVADVVVDSHETGTIRITLPGGDLDGDGFTEPLLMELDVVSYELRIGALDHDGSLLWTHTYAESEGYYAALPLYVMDFTGDASAEVAVLSIQFTGAGPICFVVGCAGAGFTEFFWRFQMLDGATGVELWSDAAPVEEAGAIVGAGAIAAVAIVGAFHFANLVYIPLPSSDVEGDGAADVIITRMDWTNAATIAYAGFFAGVLVYDEETVYQGTYEVRAGVDGSIIAERAMDPTMYPNPALPMGDVDGDGLGDIARVASARADATVCASALVAGVCTSAGTLAVALLTMERGIDGTEIWARQEADVLAQYLAAAAAQDLDGDGVRDLVLTGPLPIDTLGFAVRAIGGAGGALLWATLSSGDVLQSADVTGDGNADVVTATFGGILESVFRFQGFDGPSGAPLYDSSVQLPIDYMWDSLFLLPGDADGDGASDVLVVGVGLDLESFEDEGAYLLVSGATGAAGASRVWTGWPWFAVLEGDVLVSAYEVAQHVTWTTSRIDLAAGADVWAISEPLIYQSSAAADAVGGDMDGDGIADATFFAITQEQDSSLRGRIQGLSGADGSLLWTYGDVLDSPGPTPPGNETPVGFLYAVSDVAPVEVDITGWTNVDLGDDEVVRVDVAPVPFHGLNHTSIGISSNGFAYVGGNSFNDGCCSGGTLPTHDGVDGIIAGLWTDLDPRDCGEIAYHDDGVTVRVAWIDVEYYGGGCTPPTAEGDRARFHLSLSRATGAIEIHLLRADGGNWATTGIESPDGETGNETRSTSSELGAAIAWRFDPLGYVNGTQPPAEGQNDAGSGADAPNDFDGALLLAPGNYTGELNANAGDGEDWYAVTMGTTQVLTVRLEAYVDFNLRILRPDGVQIAASASELSIEELTITAGPAGDYRVVVDAFEPAGAYALGIAVEGTPAEPPEPYYVVYAATGLIGCAFALGPMQTGDYCGEYDPNAQAFFDVPMDGFLDNARVSVQWDPTNPLAADSLQVDWLVPVAFGSAAGGAPLVADFPTTGQEPWYYAGAEGRLKVGVGPNAGITYQTGFEVCVVLTYGGATAPADACDT